MYLLNYILKLQVLCKNCIVWTVLVALYFCFVYVRECSIMWECGRRQRRRTWILCKIVSERRMVCKLCVCGVVFRCHTSRQTQGPSCRQCLWISPFPRPTHLKSKSVTASVTSVYRSTRRILEGQYRWRHIRRTLIP